MICNLQAVPKPQTLDPNPKCAEAKKVLSEMVMSKQLSCSQAVGSET